MLYVCQALSIGNERHSILTRDVSLILIKTIFEYQQMVAKTFTYLNPLLLLTVLQFLKPLFYQ